MKKFKLLWFALIPLTWYLAFLFVKWLQYYPIDCSLGAENSPFGLCAFIGLSGVFGTIIIIGLGIFITSQLIE